MKHKQHRKVELSTLNGWNATFGLQIYLFFIWLYTTGHNHAKVPATTAA